jgi:hypothetical protein
MQNRHHYFACLVAALALALTILAPTPALFAQNVDPNVYQELQFRHIGPEGNRVIAIASHSAQPDVIYAGAASGGIWKTADGALSWEPIFDDTGVASIGSLAVSSSDPSVVWAGTGETNIRSMISIGNGIYKSSDAGKSWRKMGWRRLGESVATDLEEFNTLVRLHGLAGISIPPEN